MKIVSVDEMRRLEQATDAAGHSYAAMMDMAGRAVAETTLNLILPEPEIPILILVGPGNNGGDGLVAARYLLEAGNRVTVYIWRRNIKGDSNFQQLKRRGQRRGLALLWAENDPDFTNLRAELQNASVVVDALLGTGATGPIEGQLADLLAVARAGLQARRQPTEDQPAPPISTLPRFPIAEATLVGAELPNEDNDDWPDYADDLDYDPFAAEYPGNGDEEDLAPEGLFDLDLGDDEDLEAQPALWPPLPVVAVDCPSGLNAGTGELDPAALHAEITVTFAYPKWGQLQYPGAGACGLLGVADIGIPPELAAEVPTELVEPGDIRRMLPLRPVDAHKGTFGKAMIAAGSLNYTGAAYLAGSAATRAGAGLVTLAIPAALHTVLAGALHETTWLPLADEGGCHSAAGVPQLLVTLAGYSALLVGPGLSTLPGAQGFIERLFGPAGLPPDPWQGRLVADADALNILASLADWPARLPAESILTPHPGEMARLTGLTVSEINARRIATARQWATEWGHIVLLKGPHTVVAAPDGRAVVLPFANPVLATAGSGDVLAGIIAAMLAQDLPAFEAAVCAAYLHGHAGLLLLRAVGPAGPVAGDLVAKIPLALNQLRAG